MKTTLLSIVLLILSPSVFASEPVVKHSLQVEPPTSPWSFAVYWDARSKTTNAVVLRRVGLIQNPLGAKFDLEVDAFAGSDINSNLLAGFSIGKTFPVAKNVDFKFGVAVSTQQNRPAGAGLLVGATWRF